MKMISLLALLLSVFSIHAEENLQERYFRNLRYNHVSPHVDIKGIHEIDAQEAARSAHYVFKYTADHQLAEIINHNYHRIKRHPLATIGAYRTVFSYDTNSETRIFFDIKGNRMTNDRGVYKEVYTYDKNGFKYALDFYDENDQPMNSNWNISTYRWSKNKKLVIEKRYDLGNTLMDISPYFEFGITGILYRKDGSPKCNYNLNEQLKITANSVGVASYSDVYDQNGNHVEFSYQDEKGKLTNNQWKYAKAVQKFNNKGELITIQRYDKEGKLIGDVDFPSPSNIKIAAPVSKQDSLEIKEKALGYLIALQELKPELMSTVFHPDLAKRTFRNDWKTKKDSIHETTYKEMVSFAESWNKSGTKFPPKPSNQAIILDVYHRIATVKLVSDNWVEYLHLVKTNERWNIINLLWQYKNINRYPKAR